MADAATVWTPGLVAFAALFGFALFAFLAIDLRLYVRYGHTQTMSHGMYLWGRRRPAVAAAALTAGAALLAAALSLHFWG